MKIVLIHGFNVRDGGARTVDQLSPYLIKAGFEVEMDDADYGYYSLWKVRFRKHSAVRRIAKALETADIVISHSNGGNYEDKALKCLEHRDRHYKIIRISPALNSKQRIPENVERGFVFFTRTDKWVWLSGLLVGHSWGRQGQKGYKGDDRRMFNHDYSEMIKGHSDWFNQDNIEFTAQEVLSALEK